MSCSDLLPGSASEENLIRLMDRYAGLLMGLCVMSLRDYQLAQDVVQETFLRAWRFGRLRPETEKAWLVRVAVNLCRDQRRSRWQRYVDRSVTPEDMLIPVLPAPGDVVRAVQRLPAKEREVIVLHFWGNLSAAEIADALQIGRTSVYRRMDRAKKRLRLELDDKEVPQNDRKRAP